jgi:hypothetical protein
VLLEAQEIAHLPRHRHRRQQFNLGTRYNGVINPGTDRPIEDCARVIERALTAVDEGEHGPEIPRGATAALGGEPKINDRSVAIDQRSDASPTICSIEGDEPHGAISFLP